jgi:hypothetical protein
MAGSNRALGQWSVPPIGLGCMNLSHAYGVPPSKQEGEAVIRIITPISPIPTNFVVRNQE